MEPKGCKTDVLTQELATVLEVEYGVSRDEIDSGYMVTELRDGEFVSVREGECDGCISYREAISKAAEVATSEVFSDGGGNSCIVKLLAEDHGIKLPWLFYDEADGASIDMGATWKAVSTVQSIVSGAMDAHTDVQSKSFRKDIAYKIFKATTPFAQFRTGEVDPFYGVWRLHMAMMLGGLESSFVLIQDDPLGEHLHQHVALSVKIGEGESVIVDPAYETFDLKGMNPVPLDITQALSYHYYHEAMCTDEPQELIEMARMLDESNPNFALIEAMAKSDARDPLWMTRSFYWDSFERAVEILKGEAEALQSSSEASLDLVMRSFR